MQHFARFGSRLALALALVAVVASGGCATSIDDTSGVGGKVRVDAGDSGGAGDQGVGLDGPVGTDSGGGGDTSRGVDSGTTLDTGAPPVDSDAIDSSGPLDTGAADSGTPPDTTTSFDTDPDTGTVTPDTASPGCTADSDCKAPFNCCDLASGKCGVIAFFVCVPF